MLITYRTAFALLAIVLFGAPSLAGDINALKKMSKLEKELFELINAERKKKDLPPLKANAKLHAAARGHSINMAKQKKMSHKLDGKTAVDRIKAAGYKPRAAGENIGYGKVPLATMMKLWMNSKFHRENILNKRYTELGVGIGYTSDGVPYFTHVFGTPLQ